MAIYHLCVVFWAFPNKIKMIIFAPEIVSTLYQNTYFQMAANSRFLQLGPFGVALFFLISGFVIPFSLKKLTASQFMINRILRILPTYAVGFFFSLSALKLCTTVFHLSWPFTLSEVLFHITPLFRDILWSRHIDYIIWSLEVEIKFYIICVLLIGLFKKMSRAVFSIPFLMLALSVLFSISAEKFQNDFLLYKIFYVSTFSAQFISFMFIGVLFHYYYASAVSLKLLSIGSFFFLVLFMVQWNLGPIKDSEALEMPSYLIAFAVFTLSFWYRSKIPRFGIFETLADISYPLYVTHGISGYVIMRVLSGEGYSPIICILAAFLSTFSLAILIHKAIELPTLKLTKRLTENKF